MIELVGWCSSVVLLTTIITQIFKQWQARSAEGVSPWLFAGQFTASLGFTIYSALLHNWIFTLTNAAMLLSAVVGGLVTAHFKRHPSPKSAAPNASG